MLPFQNLIPIDRGSEHPIFLQIVNELTKLIQKGQLSPSSKLPGSRTLANLLKVHRNTVVKALEELEALGWIEVKPNRGAFVVESFPVVKPDVWGNEYLDEKNMENPPFEFYDFPNLSLPYSFEHTLSFDDGLPDIRLAPIDELARSYSQNMKYLAKKRQLTYTDGTGHPLLKKSLTKMLNETRGLNVKEENILITRGTIMAIHLAVAVTVRPGDKVVAGESNYQTADLLLQHFGAELIRIPVDEHGVDVRALEKICSKHKIRAIYVTSHHHHPTTVTLSPERRIRLLQLAKTHNFIILEDDYDYDFHYDNSPILPLASGDRNERVFYFGSFSKVVAPAFRVGYLVGPARIIAKLPKLRRMLDRQGDPVLEKSIADLIDNGILRRHLRKSLKAYKARKDYCCERLEKDFSEYISFKKPAGGMAIWAEFEKGIDLKKLNPILLKKGLFLSSGTLYHTDAQEKNACRMGFASLDLQEMDKAFDILKEGIGEVRRIY